MIYIKFTIYILLWCQGSKATHRDLFVYHLSVSHHKACVMVKLKIYTSVCVYDMSVLD